MLENTQPTPPSEQPSAHAGHDDSRSTTGASSPQEASPQRDDASERAINERWENDLETDQTERLLGHEAIEDSDISDDEFPEALSQEISEDF